MIMIHIVHSSGEEVESQHARYYQKCVCLALGAAAAATVVGQATLNRAADPCRNLMLARAGKIKHASKFDNRTGSKLLIEGCLQENHYL